MEHSNQPPLSPRARIIAGLAPDSLVVGYRESDRSWVTAADPPSDDTVAWLPGLDGVLMTGEAVRRLTGVDYGGVVSRSAAALLRPGSQADVARMVEFAASHGIPVTARGQSHTNFGQSQVEDGLQIDLRTLDRIAELGDGSVEVEAGSEWRSVIKAALTHGQTPPVLTDYQRLTVGGTLSVGGIGGMSWREGAQVDNVLALTVVTGEGKAVRCSENDNSDLFLAALAGLGQCGVIVSARLRLIPAPATVRIHDLPYASIPAAISDLRRVVQEERFDYAVILIVPAPQGWITVLEVLSYDASRSDEELLDGLEFLPEFATSFDQPYFDFIDRVLPQIGDLQAAGLADYPHPWVDLFVPGSKVESYVSEVFETLTPADLGRSFPILLYPFRSEPLSRPLFRVPDEPDFYLFDILRAATPGATDLATMLRHNRELFERNRELGGTHYVISAIEIKPEDWKRHYGKEWDRLVDAKRRFDPNGVLTPGPGIFPPGYE